MLLPGLFQQCRVGHQLHRVERTAPQMGLDRRVGRDAVKAVEHLAVGKRGQIAHAGRVGRVPAERRVQCVEHAIASQKCLGGAVFLRRAAEIDHRARCTGRFQIGLDGKRRSERTDAEQVMPTAVTTEAAGGFLMRHARLLAQIHQCVEFARIPMTGRPLPKRPEKAVVICPSPVSS